VRKETGLTAHTKNLNNTLR